MTPQQLRNSILQMAIEGKLTRQLPEDGNAADLLKKIKAEKAKLIKEKKIKKEKPLPEIGDDEIPFEIPDNWCWVRLGNLVSVLGDGIHGTPEYDVDGEYYFVNGNNLSNGRIVFKGATKKVSYTEYVKYAKELNSKTILVSINGTIGNVAFYDGEKVVLGKSACYFNLLNYLEKRYLYRLLKTDYFIKYAVSNATGSTIKNVSLKVMKEWIVPLPPLEEQKRIVARLEKILPLVDAYEKAYNELQELNKKFPVNLKNSLLQMAIEGKLVEQRPEDGNAADLLKKIKAEKARLIKEKKIKKEKPLPPITEDEIPFEIPDNWVWARLGSILTVARGGSPRPIKDYLTSDDNGINWIKIGDTDKGEKYINSTAEKIKPEGLKKSRYVQKGDFLLSNSMSYGRPYILNIDGCIHDGWLVLRQYKQTIYSDYLYYLLSSRFVYEQFSKVVAGAVVNNLNSEKVAITVVPIPPVNEQKRIVDKLARLLPLCDELMKHG